MAGGFRVDLLVLQHAEGAAKDRLDAITASLRDPDTCR